MLSAFAKKYKTGEIDLKKYNKIEGQFVTDWNYLLKVEFQDDILPIIRKVIATYRLRAADSVHFSSALWLENSIIKDIIIKMWLFEKIEKIYHIKQKV